MFAMKTPSQRTARHFLELPASIYCCGAIVFTCMLPLSHGLASQAWKSHRFEAADVPPDPYLYPSAVSYACASVVPYIADGVTPEDQAWQSWANTVHQATDEYRASRFNDALKTLRDALAMTRENQSLDAERSLTELLIAQILLVQGEFARAESEIDSLLAREGQLPSCFRWIAYSLKARALWSVGKNYDGLNYAVISLGEALEEDEQSDNVPRILLADLALLYGTIGADLGDLLRAQESINALSELLDARYPNETITLALARREALLGRICLESGCPNQALSHCQKAIDALKEYNTRGNHELVHTLLIASRAALNAGELDLSSELIAAADRTLIVPKADQPILVARIEYVRSLNCLKNGEDAEGQHHLENAMDILATSPYRELPDASLMLLKCHELEYPESTLEERKAVLQEALLACADFSYLRCGELTIQLATIDEATGHGARGWKRYRELLPHMQTSVGPRHPATLRFVEAMGQLGIREGLPEEVLEVTRDHLQMADSAPDSTVSYLVRNDPKRYVAKVALLEMLAIAYEQTEDYENAAATNQEILKLFDTPVIGGELRKSKAALQQRENAEKRQSQLRR